MRGPYREAAPISVRKSVVEISAPAEEDPSHQVSQEARAMSDWIWTYGLGITLSERRSEDPAEQD
jgi:hypothetical protein